MIESAPDDSGASAAHVLVYDSLVAAAVGATGAVLVFRRLVWPALLCFAAALIACVWFAWRTGRRK